MKTISIHQPNYIPWLPYFDKIKRSDFFIIYDDAQYKKNEFMNRNKIKISDGWTYLTIPIESKKCYLKPINIVELPQNEKWKKKHWKSIVINYSKCDYFKKYSDIFIQLFELKFNNLSELNIFFIKKVLEILDFKTEIIISSEVDFENRGATASHRLINMIKYLNGTKYISGPFGESYLNKELFKKEGIDLEIQRYRHPTYKQRFGNFIPGLSIIDLLFNEGKKTRDIL